MKYEFDLNVEGMHKAAQHLAKSDKGFNTLTHLDRWMSDGGLSLDHINQQAMLALIFGAFGSLPGTVRDVVSMAVEESGVDQGKAVGS